MTPGPRRPGADAASPLAQRLRSAVARELADDLLPFWRQRSLDVERGGFVGEMTRDGTPVPGAAKGSVLQARLLWAFAALHRRFGDARDRELMERAADYLETRFRDRRHGGYRWQVDADGRPRDDSKKIYGQAFCIYALSEQHLATGAAEPLADAREVYELVERHARDRRHGGYLEARDVDWSRATDLRLSDKDPAAPKSMNTHLHLLEAYTNLYRAWPDPGLAERVRQLVDLFGRHIRRSGANTEAGHLRHFFDEAWRPLAPGYTYGHDIESVWLLGEAVDALRDETLRPTVDAWSVATARAVLAEGIDAEGAVAYSGRNGAVTGPDREWWCQAEGVVGFWHAYELTADAAFARAAAGIWDFVARRVVDRVHGEWFWRVRADGSVDAALPKVAEWKGPYHGVRMCLEMLRRLDPATAGSAP